VAPKETTNTNGYLNSSSIEDGGTVRLAILSESPVEGVEVWFNKKSGGMTKRITPDWPDQDLLDELCEQVGGVVTERDGKKAIKRCTAFFVYDFDAEAVRVFSANQQSLLSDIDRLTSDEDYADLSKWDLKITRNGTLLDTRYHAGFVPTKRSNEKVAKAVMTAWDEVCSAGADLEALYDGGNPFGTKGK
jgi:hypothetical protein